MDDYSQKNAKVEKKRDARSAMECGGNEARGDTAFRSNGFISVTANLGKTTNRADVAVNVLFYEQG